MKKILLVGILLAALPLSAAAFDRDHHHDRDHHRHVSHGTSLDLDGDHVVITRDRVGRNDEVIVGADGDLEVNGRRIAVDDDQRGLLVKFHRETVKLEKMSLEIGADAEEIAAASTQYAVQKVRAALRSLGEEDDADADEADEILPGDFEARVDRIEKFADRIEKQADRVTDLARDLKHGIPALGDLDWFLDD